MFIPLKHKSLDIYQTIRELTSEIYKLTTLLPAEERFNMMPQLRRAELSVKLNFSEGCSRRSATERKRVIEIARGSVVEIDAALETAFDLNYFNKEDLLTIDQLLNKCFAMLSNMMK